MSAPENRSLRVALPISSFLPARGGAEIGLHNIASRLAALGHEPVVITSLTHARALKKTNWKLPYAVVAYPPRLLTLRGRGSRLARLLLKAFHGRLQRRFRFDVWHATFGFPVGVSVIEFCRERGIAHLVRCVGDDIQVKEEIGYGMRRDPGVDAEVRRWLPKAQCLVAITHSVAEEYRKLGIPEDIIERIPNGVDVRRFTARETNAALRRSLGLAPGVILFLSFGRFHPKKNLGQLIEAAALLRPRRGKDFHVLIAGKGVSDLEAERDRNEAGACVSLMEPAQAAQADDRVVELPDDEAVGLYKAADVFVMPSIVETFGIVTVEAMAAGLAIIAANSPGSRDVIRGGRDGLIYDGTAAGLAVAMEKMMDASIRKSWSAKSMGRAREFDWDKVVGEYAKTYRRLIAECRAGAYAAGEAGTA